MLNKKLSAISLGLTLSALTVAPMYAEELVTPVPQPAYAQAKDTKETQANQPNESTSGIQATQTSGEQAAGLTSVVKPALADATPVTSSDAKVDNHPVSKFPHRLAVFTAGIFVGTPLAIAHQSKTESISGVTDLVGTNRNPFVLLPAIVISVPFGIASGIFGGPTTTAYHSLKHCGDDPVTKESLGIGSGTGPNPSK